MPFLDAVWIFSLLMAIASMLLLLVLIFARMQGEPALKRKEELKRQWSHRLHALLNAPIPLEGLEKPVIRQGDEQAICDVAFDMLRVIRGKDSERLIACLADWKIDTWLRQTALRGTRGKRICALALLAKFNTQEDLETLFTAAKDKDSYVQMAALRGIAGRKDPALLSRLVQTLADSSHQTNTLMLADVLKTFREPGVEELLRLTVPAMSRAVRLAAIRALGVIGSRKSVEPLIQLASDNDQDIRAQTMVALGRSGDARAQETIYAGLESKEFPVRLSAAQAAGNLGLRHAIPKLANLLSDPVWWVRYRAAIALYQLGTAGQDMLDALAAQQNMAGEMARQILAEKREAAA